MRRSDLHITQIPTISAIYFGLLNSGYDFYHFERDEQHTALVNHFSTAAKPLSFFRQARQNTCEAYPYWPRAALMETASFYLTSDCADWDSRDALIKYVMNTGNISDYERDTAFWSWLDHFPEALKQVMESPCFVHYLQWERKWIAEQSSRYANELQRIADMLHRSVDKYHSPVKNMQIVLNPIKCVYSADYHLVDDHFIFSSGRFQMASIVHEFLHHVVHPVVAVHRQEILSNPMKYPEIDCSYYVAGQMNAFEEYMVRRLTRDAMNDHMPNDLHDYLQLLMKQ